MTDEKPRLTKLGRAVLVRLPAWHPPDDVKRFDQEHREEGTEPIRDMSLEEVQQRTEDATAMPTLNGDQTGKALEGLEQAGYVREVKGRWKMTKEGHAAIHNAEDPDEIEVDGPAVIEPHPAHIDLTAKA